MTSIILLIQLILVIVSVASMIKMHFRNKKNKEKSMKAFNDAKRIGESISVPKSYLNQVNFLFQKNKIKGEKIKAEGVFRTEAIATKSKYGTSVSYEYFIDDMRVMLPQDMNMIDGESYKVEGIFYKAALYVTLVNGINLLDRVEAMENLKPYRETSKYEEALMIRLRKILIAVFLIIFAVFPFWKLNAKIYICLYALLILAYFVDLRRKKKILYLVKGTYEEDEFGNENIGGVKVKAFDYSKLSYEAGDEVEAVGYKDKNNLLLIQYQGFDYIKEYKKARKFNYMTNIVFIIIFGIISTVFFNISGVKRYVNYLKIKDKKERYESIDELSKDVELNQYVDLSNLYLFPADFNSSPYLDSNDYLAVDKDRYLEEVKKVEDKIKELRAFEEKTIWLIENIDFALIYEKNEFIENNEKYKKLKKLYFDESVSTEEVRRAYNDFEDDIHKELNNQIVNIQREIYSNLDRKVIIKDVYRAGGAGYYHSFSKGPGSKRALGIFNSEELKGIVSEVEDKENIKYIKLSYLINYKNINERKELLWILGLYISFIMLLLASTLFEIYKKIKIEKQ